MSAEWNRQMTSPALGALVAQYAHAPLPKSSEQTIPSYYGTCDSIVYQGIIVSLIFQSATDFNAPLLHVDSDGRAVRTLK